MFKQFLDNDSPRNEELKKLYFLIHKYGPIGKADIIEKTKIKQTTLVRMLDELQKHRFIESHFGESQVGRPPILYDVEKTCNYIIGIHISRMKTNIVLLDLRFNVVDQETFVMTSIHTPDFVFMKIENTIREFMKVYGFDESTLLGIGIATMAPIIKKEGAHLPTESSFVANWGNVPLVELMEEKFPNNKIILEKSTNAAVTAEYHAESFNYRNILYCINGGWGMDCGVIMDGYVLQDRYASNYGHMIIDVDGHLCTCGKRGCLVAYTTFKGILDQLEREKKLVGAMNDELFQQASLDDMMEYFVQGEKHTKEVILRSSRYLGIGLSNFINLFNPELVILSGPFIYAYEDFYELVIDHTKHYLQDGREVVFSQGALKENGSAVGIGILLFRSHFNNFIKTC